MVVVSCDADNFGAENIGAKNLCRLQIRGNKDPRLQAFPRSMRGDGIGQISGGRARNRVESEFARVRQRYGNHAVLEAQRRQADGIVLDVEIPRSSGRSTQLRGQVRGLQQWSEADR